jgi:hypothetical protein
MQFVKPVYVFTARAMNVCETLIPLFSPLVSASILDLLSPGRCARELLYKRTRLHVSIYEAGLFAFRVGPCVSSPWLGA